MHRSSGNVALAPSLLASPSTTALHRCRSSTRATPSEGATQDWCGMFEHGVERRGERTDGRVRSLGAQTAPPLTWSVGSSPTLGTIISAL